jgi:hypothetical protein
MLRKTSPLNSPSRRAGDAVPAEVGFAPDAHGAADEAVGDEGEDESDDACLAWSAAV